MIKSNFKKFAPILISLFLLVVLAGCESLGARSDKAGDPYRGGWVWNNYTKELAGGSGELPEGVEHNDYVRCKACHGWDAKGPNGGYVRRSGFPDKTSRPKPTEGTDLTNKLGNITANFAKRGRDWSTENNEMPNYSHKGGLTRQQQADVVAFMNRGPKIGDVATLDITQKPVKYTFINADIDNGQALYTKSCKSCHAADGKNVTIGHEPGENPNGLIDFFRKDGKYSEGFHKIMYGEDKKMTREAAGNLNTEQARDILTFIQSKADDPGKTGLDQ